MSSGRASVPQVASGGSPLFSNTEIVEDLVEEVVDEGFAEDAPKKVEKGAWRRGILTPPVSSPW